MAISLVVGLGNPGEEYLATRHNVGFWFVDQLASLNSSNWRSESRLKSQTCKVKSSEGDYWLQKPTTFMNHSGHAVVNLANYYKIKPESILVVHDDLDLPAGSIKVKQGGGHGGHNGLRDITSHIGANFMRLRIGIGHPGSREAVTPFVLGRPSKIDKQAIDDALIEASAALPLLITGELEKAQNLLHGGR